MDPPGDRPDALHEVDRRLDALLARPSQKFHRYEDLDPTPTIDRLLAEIDADPICIFWG